MGCMRMYNDYKLQRNKDSYIMIGGTITNLKHQSNRWAFVAIPASLKNKSVISEQDQVNNLNMNEFGAN